MLLIVGLSFAQAAGAEPAKVEAPAVAPGRQRSGSEERRSRSGGAVYSGAVGTDRRSEGSDGHDVDADRRHAGVFHEPRVRHGRVRSVPR